ncbi:hypothetical protein HMI56_005180 [Coelomomyces lativittatus]|nr:hypothetical protein HMI56_005180 [Coelomomyces lativittatus]
MASLWMVQRRPRSYPTSQKAPPPRTHHDPNTSSPPRPSSYFPPYFPYPSSHPFLPSSFPSSTWPQPHPTTTFDKPPAASSSSAHG